MTCSSHVLSKQKELDVEVMVSASQSGEEKRYERFQKLLVTLKMGRKVRIEGVP